MPKLSLYPGFVQRRLPNEQAWFALLLALCAAAACERSGLTLSAAGRTAGSGTETGSGPGAAGVGGNLGGGGALDAGTSASGGGSSGSGGSTAIGGTDTGGTLTSGGTGGAGGSSSSTAASCPNVDPCGGILDGGEWTVTSSCLNVSGQLDLSMIGIGCMSALVTGSLQVRGTWTAHADRTYVDNTTTTGREQITLAASCLKISGTTVDCSAMDGVLLALGYNSVTCTAASSGGCTCTAIVNQTGGIGWVSANPPSRGHFEAGVSMHGSYYLVTTDSGAQYSYCLSAYKMTWIPQTTSPTTTGTIAFQEPIP